MEHMSKSDRRQNNEFTTYLFTIIGMTHAYFDSMIISMQNKLAL